jgi:hypothetical protein
VGEMTELMERVPKNTLEVLNALTEKNISDTAMFDFIILTLGYLRKYDQDQFIRILLLSKIF